MALPFFCVLLIAAEKEALWENDSFRLFQERTREGSIIDNT